jgi:diphosphomevalonate decarboxylase
VLPARKLSFDLLFEGVVKEAFRPKIEKFLERIMPYCGYLKNCHLQIDTQNTFPHSSGIASSASGMAALALNIMSYERSLFPEITDEYFYAKASFLARLGSGSACRSIQGKVVVWGDSNHISGSSNLYGVPFSEPLHPIFDEYQDTILLVDKGEKKVSSTLGHDLMIGHTYASSRFLQAQNHLHDLKETLISGDLTKFTTLVELEALTLHAMMMTSNPYFILMRPNTLQILEDIWTFRKDTQIPVCFTLDAGANVHVLYPKSYSIEVMSFINAKLVGFCQNDHYICDALGSGSMPV